MVDQAMQDLLHCDKCFLAFALRCEARRLTKFYLSLNRITVTVENALKGVKWHWD